MTCHTIERYDENGQPVFKQKKKYDTLDLAIASAKFINSHDHIIHKVVAYKCPICFKYHIGRNGSVLKEKDRIKYQRKKIL